MGTVLATGEIEFCVSRVHEGRAFTGVCIDALAFIGKHRGAPVAEAVLFGDEEVGKLLSRDAVSLLAGGGFACGGEDDFVVVVADPTGGKVGVSRGVDLFQGRELIFRRVLHPFLNQLYGLQTTRPSWVVGHSLDVNLIHFGGFPELLVHLVGLGQAEIHFGVGVGVVGFQQPLVVGFGPLGEAYEAVAFTQLEGDAVAFFLVAAQFAVGFPIAVGGFGVLLAPEGQIGVSGRVSSLCVEVAAHEDEQDRQQDEDVFFHRRKFSFCKRGKVVFYCSLIQTTKIQQFGETNGVAEKKNDDYSIAVETSIRYCLISLSDGGMAMI